MARIGLTGGIGSGKTTVAHMLAARGAQLIDADAISRQLTAADGGAIAAIRSQFGPDAVTPVGDMDRDAMRRMALTDPAARRLLESIIHPLVSAEVERLTQLAIRAGSACIVFDIPLLVESGRWRSQLDRVVVVDCLEATQVARVVARSGWSAEAVHKVIAIQASREQRRAAADLTIYNDALTLDALAALVAQISARFGL